MKLPAFFLTLLFSLGAVAQNVEIRATYVSDNQNYIYMESETEKLKIKKSELTEEGVEQILKNKGAELTLFIPPKSIVQRLDKPAADGL